MKLKGDPLSTPSLPLPVITMESPLLASPGLITGQALILQSFRHFSETLVSPGKSVAEKWGWGEDTRICLFEHFLQGLEREREGQEVPWGLTCSLGPVNPCQVPNCVF